MAKRRLLNSDEQIEKLERLTTLALQASAGSLIERLGAVAIYAGQVDFLAIQAARLVEQIMLKVQLAQPEGPRFAPHDDAYFYDNQVSTRTILNGIKKLLPFQADDPADDGKAQEVTRLAQEFVSAASKFLNYRNAVFHHVGNPTKSFDDIESVCEKALKSYDDVWQAQRAFFEAAQPYRFSDREIDHFYGGETV